MKMKRQKRAHAGSFAKGSQAQALRRKVLEKIPACRTVVLADCIQLIAVQVRPNKLATRLPCSKGKSPRDRAHMKDHF